MITQLLSLLSVMNSSY